MKVELTKTDLRVLREFMDNCNPCKNGCAYEEMQNKDVDCIECPFTRDQWALYEKLFASKKVDKCKEYVKK